jgi:hypothetical protein
VKVGDFVRSKANDHYGLILEVRKRVGVIDARVLWQGIACNTTWEFSEDLVSGVENELTSMRPGQ